MNNEYYLNRLKDPGSGDGPVPAFPYVQRAWGGRVAIEDITQGLTELRKQGFMR